MAKIELPRWTVEAAVWFGWVTFWLAGTASNDPAGTALEQFNFTFSLLFATGGFAYAGWRLNERFGIVALRS